MYHNKCKSMPGGSIDKTYSMSSSSKSSLVDHHKPSSRKSKGRVFSKDIFTSKRPIFSLSNRSKTPYKLSKEANISNPPVLASVPTDNHMQIDHGPMNVCHIKESFCKSSVDDCRSDCDQVFDETSSGHYHAHFNTRHQPPPPTMISFPSFNRYRHTSCPRFHHEQLNGVSDENHPELVSPPRIIRYSSGGCDGRIRIPFFRSVEEEAIRNGSFQTFPVQARYYNTDPQKISLSRSLINFNYHEVIGHPSLNIHRLRLPLEYHSLLEQIVFGCEKYAQTQETGWFTNLYSLTKQDIALREIPYLYKASRPIVSYVKKVTSLLVSSELKTDKNQPHVLKYSVEDGSNHTGVELHHDKCDFTINIMMSRSNSYQGGGTYFPEANQNVRLEFGEFLIHPGCCVHGGVDITKGNRYLMVLFANAK